MTAATTRRDVLKGLGLGAGASLLTPILSQLAAHAAGDTTAPRKRVVFVNQSNGMSVDHLQLQGEKPWREAQYARAALHEAPLAGKKLHPALEPLAPFQNRMALVQGLSGRIAIGGSGGHTTSLGALGCYPGGKGALGPTIDHLVAEAIPGVVPHVGIGMSGVTMNYSLSAYGKGRTCPVVCSPEFAYKSLFGSVAEGNSAKEFGMKTNLLDFMADDVKRSRAVLAGEERTKFDQYVKAFEDLHARQAKIAGMREAIRANAPKLGDKMTTPVSSLILEAQFETGAAALIAGLTNVLLLASGGGMDGGYGAFPEFGMFSLHGMGHGGAQSGKPSEQCFVELRQFHTKLIAGLAAKLDAVKEGSGTMLDNTLIVYLSDSGESHHPELRHWPVVLIGGLGGKLKTAGRYLEFPGYGQKNHRTMGGLYATLLHAVGKPRDEFGMDDVKLKDVKNVNGPITELLA